MDNEVPTNEETKKQLLIEDFQRFSQLHSWYKHLPIDGEDHVFLLLEGQQPRYTFNPCLTDPCPTNMHWHFYSVDFLTDDKTGKDCLKQYKERGERMYVAKFGPFLRGVCNYEFKNQHFKSTYGFEMICEGNTRIFEYLFAAYPEYSDFLKEIEMSDRLYQYNNHAIMCDIFDREQQKYLDDVLQMNVWEPPK